MATEKKKTKLEKVGEFGERADKVGKGMKKVGNEIMAVVFCIAFLLFIAVPLFLALFR